VRLREELVDSTTYFRYITPSFLLEVGLPGNAK